MSSSSPSKRRRDDDDGSGSGDGGGGGGEVVDMDESPTKVLKQAARNNESTGAR